MAGFYELAEKAWQLEQENQAASKGVKPSGGLKNSRSPPMGLLRLNVGDTNLPTPVVAIEAATEAIQRTKSGYGPAAGLPEFREAIAQREHCAVENVVVGPGSKHLLFALMSVLLQKGQRVATPSPHWPAYELACRQLGLKLVPVATKLENGWGLPSQWPLANMRIICNPLNPTSTVYATAQVRAAIEQAQAANIPLVLDEAYKELAFEPIPRYDGENVIRVRSFSKEFNMEGWRLGYAIAPREIVQKVVAFNQITITCVAPFVQKAGLACLENEKEITTANRRIWKSRLEVAEKALQKSGFRFVQAQAGIYLFAAHPSIQDADEFALSLLEHEGVVVSPGSGFGGFKKFIRICVNQPEEKLVEAIGKMKQLVSEA